MAAPAKPDPKTQRIKEELEKDKRDVADLWSEALRKYKGIAGTDLQPKFKNVDEMIAFGTQEMNAFHKFRHNQKKIDKLRGLFMANIGYIEKGAQQLIAAATPAFPPAAAIGTALTYVLSACKAVSADYDVVVAFFEDLSAFLQRITILESRLPRYPAYRNCLMDVFSSMLMMCGFATKYIELGRFKKWVINLVGGQDGELSGARASMDKQLTRLQSATEFAILANTEDTLLGNKKLQDMNVELQQNQDLQTQMMEDQTKMLTSVVESQEAVRNDLKNIQKLLTMFDSQRREETAKRIPKAATQGKSPTSLRVRTFFQDMLDPTYEYHNIKDGFVSDTCQWIFEDERWQRQIGRTEAANHPRILAISGPAGSGKSYLAVSACDHLINNADGNTCVASYFFRANRARDLRDLTNAINYIVIQVAEQNAALCERLNVELAREDLEVSPYEWKDVWNSLIVPLFPAEGQYHLQIVWDGLDEIQDGYQDELMAFLAELKNSAALNITLVCTSREDKNIDSKLQEAEAAYIQVTKQKQATDLQALIWHHLNNDEGLKKFSKYGKQIIVDALIEKSDVMLYAEEVLRQFNAIRREPLVLKQLSLLSGSWLKLYEFMLHELEMDISERGKDAVKTLLCWLCFSYDTLTLDQCKSFLLISGRGDFNLERDMQGNNLTKFLRLADVQDQDREDDTDTPDIRILDNKPAESVTSDGNIPLRFHHRSMQDFCRSAVAGDSTLRTPRGQAHTEIFLKMARVLGGQYGDDDVALRPYAASHWAYHLSWCGFADSSDEQKIAIIESIGDIALNRKGAASRIEAYGDDYDVQAMTFDDMAGDIFAYICEAALRFEAKLDAKIVAWARSVHEATENAFVPLLRAHTINWLQAKDWESIQKSYKFARTCAKLTPLKSCIKGGSDDDDDDDEENDNEMYEKEEILGLYNGVHDLPADGNAFWSLAALLGEMDHHEEALSYAKKALELLKEESKIVEALGIIASAQLGLEDYEGAVQNTEKALSYHSIAPKMRRLLLILLAKIQTASEKINQAAKTHRDLRAIDVEDALPGNVLDAEYQLYAEHRTDAELIALLQEWTVTEQLTCMTWNLEGRTMAPLHFTAARCGQEEVVYRIYDNVIKLLDNVSAGPPVRVWYAVAKRMLSNDLESSKTLLNEVLDAPSDGWPYKFSNVDASATLATAIITSAGIIYEQYRTTTDRELRKTLFAEINALTSKPMAQSLQVNKTDTTYHTITIAKMTKKMGTAVEYQDRLNMAFETCYEALVDTVGWNDWQNIVSLSMIVAQMPGLEREAQILLSAMFSELDASESADGGQDDAVAGANGDENGSDDAESGDGSDEDEAATDADDDETPTDEGDLSGADVWCSGDCNPQVQWEFWKGRTMHVCQTCYHTALCDQCYEKRMAMNEHPESFPFKGPYFCNKDHSHISAPVEGWGGITKGVMSIEAEEDVEWKIWLEELRNEKWVKAWERFWLEE